MRWAAATGRTVARCADHRLVEPSAAWVAEAIAAADRHAEVWLASALSVPATSVAKFLTDMTRYDFDTLWRTCPPSPHTPSWLVGLSAPPHRPYCLRSSQRAPSPNYFP